MANKTYVPVTCGARLAKIVDKLQARPEWQPPRAAEKGLAFAEVLRERLMEAASDDPKDRRTKLEMVVNALIDQARSRDVQAIREIAARLDGRVPEATPFEMPFDPADLCRREAEVMQLFEPGAVNNFGGNSGARDA